MARRGKRVCRVLGGGGGQRGAARRRGRRERGSPLVAGREQQTRRFMDATMALSVPQSSSDSMSSSAFVAPIITMILAGADCRRTVRPSAGHGGKQPQAASAAVHVQIINNILVRRLLALRAACPTAADPPLPAFRSSCRCRLRQRLATAAAGCRPPPCHPISSRASSSP